MEMLINLIHQGFSAIIPFVLLLGILIFVHELGHFLVAIWCGVRVEVFSLGFGKKILKFKKGDTTYALSIIPLGGYVKMFGEQVGSSISEEDKKFAFTHKTVWQRVAIVLAGPLMNFFFAILIFFTVALIGEEVKVPVIGDVSQTSSAYKAGFRSGDLLLMVNDKKISSWEDYQKLVSLNDSSDVKLDFLVQHQDLNQESKISVVAKAEPNPNVLSRYSFIASIDGLTTYSSGTTMGVAKDSPLAPLGMQSGDSILAINGIKTRFLRELNPLLEKLGPQQELTLEIVGVRDGEKSEKPMTITLAGNTSLTSYSLQNLGLESSELYIAKVVEQSPAAQAGLKEMDRVSSINGITLNKWEDVVENIKSFDGTHPVKIQVIRQGEPTSLEIIPKMTSQMTPAGSEDKRYTIGISPLANIAAPEFITKKAPNVFSAFTRGVERTWDVSVMTALSFVRLFEAKISPKNIGGVLSIGQAASETFKIGITQFLQMMAIISVNLFILNLLPIPVLDGGHLIFYIIEIIKGGPVSIKKMEIAQQVGMALLMSLMIFALFNDFTRLLGH